MSSPFGDEQGDRGEDDHGADPAADQPGLPGESRRSLPGVRLRRGIGRTPFRLPRGRVICSTVRDRTYADSSAVRIAIPLTGRSTGSSRR